jgi:S-adenosylmethionine:tRNA ribosyltransferase-isomerase
MRENGTGRFSRPASAAGRAAATAPTAGWTHLVLDPDRPARAVTGLVGAAYARAVREHRLWHEFGDSTVFLP